MPDAVQTINLDNIRFVKYDPLLQPLIKVSDFDCGDPDLNGFLKDDLEHHREQMMTQSVLIVHDTKIIGYYTLQADAIQLAPDEKKSFILRGMKYKTFPAVKIGRLAVQKALQNQGIGKLAMRYIIGTIRRSYWDVAARFITVDAKKEGNSLEFYTKFGFVPNKKENEAERETISLRYDLYNPPKESGEQQTSLNQTT